MKISIIMPTLNQLRYIGAALESVLSQAGEFELEVLVVDGGSGDGTQAYLAKLDDPRVLWTSEPDRGQSDAINKGLARATGDIVAWLNSDDLYRPGALEAVAESFQMNPSVQWLTGRCAIIDGAGEEIRPWVTAYKNRGLRTFSLRKLLRENMVSQPATFWRRSFGEQVGSLDESLHYTMDYDLWLRMAQVSPPLIVERVLAAFRMHGQSKSGQVNRRQFDEQFAVASRYFGSDRMSRVVHRFNVGKIVWAYRMMRVLGR